MNYCCLKNIKSVHWIGEESIVHTFDNSVVKFDEVETLFLRGCIQDNNIDSILNLISSYDIPKETAYSIIESIIASLDEYVYISDDSDDHKNNIIFSGIPMKFFPNSVIVSLTNRCVQKCVHCYKGDIKCTKNIDYENLVNMLNCIKGKTPFVQFTGGEPLLYPYFSELMDEFSSFFKIGVTTSGNVDNIEVLSKAHEVQISVYSHEKNIHNNFCKNQGSFDNILSNIKILNSLSVPVVVMHLVTKDNYRDLEIFINFCIDNNIKILRFGTLAPLGRAINNKVLDSFQIHELKEKIDFYADKYKDKITIIQWQSERQSLNNGTLFSCGKVNWNIMEDGDIQPCGMYTNSLLSMGNINDSHSYQRLIDGDIDSLLSTWNNDEKVSNLFRKSDEFIMCPIH